MAVPQVISSIRVNATSSDGKVFISGDHNEVVVSTAARESKNALAEIKSKLESLDKKYEEFSTRLSGLERKSTQFFFSYFQVLKGKYRFEELWDGENRDAKVYTRHPERGIRHKITVAG